MCKILISSNNRLFVVLSIITLITACSNDCVNSNDGKLSLEAKSWMSIYKQKPLFIFRNQANQQDTLAVEYKAETEFCGGEECGATCERELVVLRSRSDSMLATTIEAKDNSLIAIHNGLDTNAAYVGLGLTQKSLYVRSSMIKAQYIEDYSFNNESITVFKAFCTGSQECASLNMPLIVISKQYGLLEYSDKNGSTWTLIN